MLYSRCTPEDVNFLFAIESVLPVYDHHQFWSNIIDHWSVVISVWFQWACKRRWGYFEEIWHICARQDDIYSQGRRQPVIFNISLSETYIVFSSSFKSLINWWCITIQGKTYKWLFEGKVTFVLPGPAEWWFHPSWISEHLRSTLTGVAFSHCHCMRYLSHCLTFPQVHWWSDVIFGKTFLPNECINCDNREVASKMA